MMCYVQARADPPCKSVVAYLNGTDGCSPTPVAVLKSVSPTPDNSWVRRAPAWHRSVFVCALCSCVPASRAARRMPPAERAAGRRAGGRAADTRPGPAASAGTYRWRGRWPPPAPATPPQVGPHVTTMVVQAEFAHPVRPGQGGAWGCAEEPEAAAQAPACSCRRPAGARCLAATAQPAHHPNPPSAVPQIPFFLYSSEVEVVPPTAAQLAATNGSLAPDGSGQLGCIRAPNALLGGQLVATLDNVASAGVSRRRRQYSVAEGSSRGAA